MYYSVFKKINRFYEAGVKKRSMLKHRDTIESSQWWHSEELKKFQWNELLKLLDHAYKNVPYWKGIFDNLGLSPKNIKSYDEFKRLPVIDKDIIRKNYDILAASDNIGKTWEKSTGGSTGEPLHFKYTPESYDWRVASSRRAYGWAGSEDGKKTAYIWGTAIGEKPLIKKIKENLHHKIFRQRYYNCFEFTPENMGWVLDDINKYKPEFIVGYTNPLYEFTEYVKKAGKLAFNPEAIISAAEKLHEFQRKEISEVFGGPVFNTYGSREFMMIASECEKHKGLHISMENLFVEIVKDDGTPADPGEEGDIVITDLHNYGMPFIRYKIGDRGIASDRVCDCGRGLSLLEDVVGRELDIIRSSDGRAIPGEYFPHLMKEFSEILKFQVIQNSLDELTIKVVSSSEQSEDLFRKVGALVREITGESMNVRFELVEDIPLTKTGKFRVAISNIGCGGQK